MKERTRHLSNYMISAEPDLKLAQPNPSRIYECSSIDECLLIVPRSNIKCLLENILVSKNFFEGQLNHIAEKYQLIHLPSQKDPKVPCQCHQEHHHQDCQICLSQ